MRKDTEKMVKEAFKDITGREAKKVTSMIGEPPSEDNSYLYNILLQQFEGIVEDTAKFKYTFFIYKKNKTWNAEFVPE